MKTKEKVKQMLKGLPDNVTMEDIHYHLYVRQKVEKGLKDIRAGRFFTQEEAEKRFKKWLIK